jgi:error-prone DNA polymerase
MPWREIERRLADRPGKPLSDPPAPPPHAPPSRRIEGSVPYAELHCHSGFSFLDGASDPAELVAEAARLGLTALALTDHDGFYGVVRFAEAARDHGLPTVFGAELSLGAGPRTGTPDPAAEHLLVLADGPTGYARLGAALTEAQMAGRKGAPRLSLDRLTELAGTGTGGTADWVVLTGCRKGAVPAALEADGPAVAARRLHDLADRFGSDRVFVELWDHGHPLDVERNDALARLAVAK